jgi:hypothetical protein
MGAQIPVIVEKPLVVCGCRKIQVDTLGDHLCTCTTHSGTKKTHDWSVDQLPDLFRTTHKVKTQQVVKRRGQNCGDIELAGYLENVSGPVPLVLDLRVTHDRVVSSADPALNGYLRYPNNLDQSLNDAAADKIRRYRTDHNNNPPRDVGFMPIFLVRLGSYIVNLSEFYSYRLIGKLTAFLQLQEFCQRNQIVDSSTTSARLFLL